MANEIWTIKESEYIGGGFKVKANGQTLAQFPTLKQAIHYCEQSVQDDVEVVDFINKQGKTETVNLFED